jgi:uncharacterized membrane protein
MSLVRRSLELPESLEQLDPPAAQAQSRVRRLVRGTALERLLGGAWLGHPLHPLAVQVPIGLWLSAAVLDLAGDADKARRLLGLGLATVPTVVAAGWVDFSQLDPRQARVALVHAVTNGVAASCMAASYRQRRRGNLGAGRAWSFAGLSALLVGGALGGHLAYAQGAGVFRWTRRDEAQAQRD